MNREPIQREPATRLRDSDGRFVSEHRLRVLATARALRAGLPNRQWRTEL